MNTIDQLLNDIQSRADAATAGRWQYYWRTNDAGEADCGVFYEERAGLAHSVCRAPRYQKQDQWDADGNFIASARTDVPRLVQALRYAVKVIDGIAASPDMWRSDIIDFLQ